MARREEMVVVKGREGGWLPYVIQVIKKQICNIFHSLFTPTNSLVNFLMLNLENS